jgi:two-component system NtrC family sensor kinase
MLRVVNNLRIRWKLLVVVLPLVLVPLFVVGTVVGWIAYRQAQLGITKASMDDLDHLAHFTVDLLDAHYRQFQVYQEDKKQTIHKELATLANLAYSLAETQYRQQQSGGIDQAAAQDAARRALKRVQVGETGYIYAMTTHGDLAVHIAREGENIYNEQDEDGTISSGPCARRPKWLSPGR